MRARLDQHFLIDPAVADRIVDAASPRSGDTVVEIGPGRGILTERLLESGVRLAAVEIDERLCAGLAARWGGKAGVEFIAADFLDLDLARLPSPAKVVSNLPYSMATPILQTLLPWPGWTEAILMFQKEVAERIEAGPGGRDYGILTLSVAIYAHAERLFDVDRFSFRPPPKVRSSVVRLRRLERPRLPEGIEAGAFMRVVKAAFAQRRKMAANSIASALGLERPRVAAAMEAAGLDGEARGETLSLDQFARLSLALGVTH